MKKQFALVLGASIMLSASQVLAQAPKPTGAPPSVDTTKKTPPKPSVAEKVKTSKKHPGLFTVYQDTVTGSVQMYIRKDQLNRVHLPELFIERTNKFIPAPEYAPCQSCFQNEKII
jgi:hypothetical protein